MDWLLSVPEEAVASVAVELQARYYRALAAGNMFNFVPSARRTQAAQRAVELYRGLGEPKRLFSALMRLVLQLYYEDDHAAAATALDEARALLSPDWPPEFRINWLRRQSGIVRAQGRLQEARALIEESNRLSATAGDWRLEVMGHTVLIDLLWLDGPTSEALAAVKALTDALRARPAAPNDMDVHYANLLGILSESGDLAGARDAAREALQLLVRTRVRYFEPWVYFLWRAGQLDDAARVLGAASTQLASAVRGENEERLLRGAREGLAAALPAERLAALEKEGAALSLHALYVLLGAANRDI